jgi:hypothetical protein
MYCLITLMCQPKLTVAVAPCFVLPANRSLVGILHNNGLRHSALSYCFVCFNWLNESYEFHYWP